MMRRFSPKFTVLVALFSFAALSSLRSVHAQQETLSIPGVSSAAHAKQFVTQANGDAAGAAANKPTVVELRFRVDSGLHVHSHIPSSEFYIPTTLTFLPDSGVVVKGIVYPPGQPYSFSSAPKEKLSVYTGEFVVKATVLAPAGSHTLHGTLRYQACDNGSCFPPRTLPVSLVVEAR
ncbi:MAG: protein-disulfide reductase DsbD domain-containing protein [Acidobacteriaceae bacterium]